MPLLPNAAHIYEAISVRNSVCTILSISWEFPDLCNPRTYRLRTTPLYQATVPDPVVTLDDFRVDMEVEYQRPVPLDGVPKKEAADPRSPVAADEQHGFR